MDLRALPTTPPEPAPPELAVPWGPRDVALAIAALVGVFAASSMLLAFMIAAAAGLGDEVVEDPLSVVTPGMLLATTVVLQAGTVGVALGFGPLRYRLSWRALGFHPMPAGTLLRWAVPAMALNIAVGAVYVAIVESAAPVLVPPGLAEQLGFGEQMDGATMLAAFIVVVLFAPIAEEAFDRGFVYAGLASKWGAWPAIFASAAVFAVAHMSFGLLVPAFISGVVFAWLYWRSGSVLPALLAHTGQNAIAFVLVVL
ncbi:MAG: CPBP family intramembrane metalloprotease [Chloroflexota bacterium]|nr:CPBP family intramembrane metalloprotease [Chloroflexota bacterium]